MRRCGPTFVAGCRFGLCTRLCTTKLSKRAYIDTIAYSKILANLVMQSAEHSHVILCDSAQSGTLTHDSGAHQEALTGHSCMPRPPAPTRAARNAKYCNKTIAVHAYSLVPVSWYGCAEWLGWHLFRFSNHYRECMHCGGGSLDTIIGGISCCRMPRGIVAEVYATDR